MPTTGDELLAIKDYGGEVRIGSRYEIVMVDNQGFTIRTTGVYTAFFFYAEYHTYFKPYSYSNPFLALAKGLTEELVSVPNKQCTCGEATLKGTKHSHWCDSV
jgi:hypothetical protein